MCPTPSSHATWLRMRLEIRTDLLILTNAVDLEYRPRMPSLLKTAVVAVVLVFGCRKPEVRHLLELRVRGESSCEFSVAVYVRNVPSFSRVHLPWVSDTRVGAVGENVGVHVEYFPDQCSTPPDAIVCEAWLDGRLWRRSHGYMSRRRFVGLVGQCGVSGVVGESAREDGNALVRGGGEVSKIWLGYVSINAKRRYVNVAGSEAVAAPSIGTRSIGSQRRAPIRRRSWIP